MNDGSKSETAANGQGPGAQAGGTPPRIVARSARYATILLPTLAGTIFAWAVIAWQVFDSERNFRHNEQKAFASEVVSVAEAVRQFVEGRQRLVVAFAEDNRALIERIARNPDDQDATEELRAKLDRIFLDKFAFMIADTAGNPLLDDIEGLVGEQCRADIRGFAERMMTHSGGASGGTQPPSIHPQAANYHFDIVARWGSEGMRGVFFVSFRPTLLARMLDRYELPGHNLFLIHAERDGLIEISGAGSRDQLAASRDIRLTDWERQNILASAEIPGTRWRVVSIPDEDLFEAFDARARRNGLMIALLVAGAMSLVMAFAVRTERERGRSERALARATVELEELTQALRAEKDRAEAANKAKGHFLAQMSHEIRTPLTGVLGMADLLSRSELTPAQQSRVRTIQHSGNILINIINDILDQAKIEAGQLQIAPVPCDIVHAVEAVVDVHRDQAMRKGLDLRLHVAANCPRHVLVDPHRVGQVLANLVSNAIKFTAHGSVTVIAEAYQAAPGRPAIRFAVSDTGIGIPAETVPRLFNKFVQAEASTTRVFGGTGLGLAISKDLVTMMGGEIGVESRAGAGSRFWFWVPVEIVAAEVAGSVPREDAVADPLDILLVDDDAVIRQVVRGYLETLGHRIEEAPGGESGLRLFADRNVDLVLLDGHMPEMDGYETLRRIRRLEGGRRHTPAILLTADVFATSGTPFAEAGFDGFATKPIVLPDLVKEIGRVVGSRPTPGLAARAAETEHTPTAAEELMSADQIATLEKYAGAAGVKGLIGQALEALPGTLDALRRALADGDGKAAAEVAHKLKGSSATFGARRLSVLLAEAEKVDLERARALLPEIEATAEATAERWRAHIAGPS